MIFSAILLGITAVILLKNLLPRRRYKEATIFLAFCVLALGQYLLSCDFAGAEPCTRHFGFNWKQ